MEWEREVSPPCSMCIAFTKYTAYSLPPVLFFSEKELGVTCFFLGYVLFFLKPTKNEVRKYEQSYSPHRYPTHD